MLSGWTSMNRETDRPLRPFGAPPRPGEDPGRGRHRTVGASDANVRLARKLRKEMTLLEVLIWRELRKRPGGHKFRRQHPLGAYVLDFACLERRIAIEIDGRSHDFGDRPERDQRRDDFLRLNCFLVLRLPASYVLKDTSGAIAAIVSACDGQPPLHHQPEAGGPPPRSGEVPRKTL